MQHLQLFFKSFLYKPNVRTSIVYDISLLELLPLQCLRAVVTLRFKVRCFVCGWWILQKKWGGCYRSISCIQLFELQCDKALLPKLYVGTFEAEGRRLASNKYLQDFPVKCGVVLFGFVLICWLGIYSVRAKFVL